MANTPQIRIGFNPLFFRSVSVPLDKLLKPEESKLKDIGWYRARTQEYRLAWQISGDKRLRGIMEALGLNYYKSVLDVTVLPLCRPNNSPLTIHTEDAGDRAIDVITHELIHQLMEDNNIFQVINPDNQVNLSGELAELFGDNNSVNMNHHIAVHAVLKYIFLDILKEPSRLERDIEDSAKYVAADDYIKAWNYVETHDYKQIIEQLKKSYKELAKNS